jgi:hypothetical protein
LFTGVGGQFNDLHELTLADDAQRSIGTIGEDDLPYTGRWRPEGLLSDFSGDDSAGTWTLLIRDVTFGDKGTLNSWSLTITAGEPFTQTAEDGRYLFDNLPPDQYIIRAVPRSGWVPVPPQVTMIPGATWSDSQWTVTVVGVDDPNDPNGPDSHRNVKNVNFGNQAQLALRGDYNGDEVVDVADYVVWRKSMDQTVPPFSGADGNGDGMINQADYDVWRANFGTSLASLGGGSAVAASMAVTGDTAAQGVSLPILTSPGFPETDAPDIGEAIASSQPVVSRPVTAPVQVAANSRSLGRIVLRPRFAAAPESSDSALMAVMATRMSGHTPLDGPDRTSEASDSADDAGSLDALDLVFEMLGDIASRG